METRNFIRYATVNGFPQIEEAIFRQLSVEEEPGRPDAVALAGETGKWAVTRMDNHFCEQSVFDQMAAGNPVNPCLEPVRADVTLFADQAAYDADIAVRQTASDGAIAAHDAVVAQRKTDRDTILTGLGVDPGDLHLFD